MLIDHSRVGTSIVTSEGKRYFAHRQEIHLQGSGEIRITASQGESIRIAYQVREREASATEETTAL